MKMVVWYWKFFTQCKALLMLEECISLFLKENNGLRVRDPSSPPSCFILRYKMFKAMLVGCYSKPSILNTSSNMAVIASTNRGGDKTHPWWSPVLTFNTFDFTPRMQAHHCAHKEIGFPKLVSHIHATARVPPQQLLRYTIIVLLQIHLTYVQYLISMPLWPPTKCFMTFTEPEGRTCPPG